MVADFWKIARGWFGDRPKRDVHKITITLQMRQCSKCVFYTKRMRSAKHDKYGCVFAAKPYCTKWEEPIDTPQVWCSVFISK